MNGETIGIVFLAVIFYIIMGFLFTDPILSNTYDRIISKGRTWEARKFLRFVCVFIWGFIGAFDLIKLIPRMFRAMYRGIRDLVLGARDVSKGALDMLPKRTNVPKAKVVKRANVP